MYCQHESDCTKFYQIAHGKPVEMQCAPGTRFNLSIRTCDWPRSVECTAGFKPGVMEPSNTQEIGKSNKFLKWIDNGHFNFVPTLGIWCGIYLAVEQLRLWRHEELFSIFCQKITICLFKVQKITIGCDCAGTWNANLAGTYTFVEMYRNYPVYKVSNQALCEPYIYEKMTTFTILARSKHK